MCLKKSCFPDCWKVLSVVYIFKNVGERSTAKNYHPVSLLSVVSKVFEKLVYNVIVDHLQKCGLFCDFQCGFRSSRWTADLLTVVTDRIARVFNRSGATRAVALAGFELEDCESQIILKFLWISFAYFSLNSQFKILL